MDTIKTPVNSQEVVGGLFQYSSTIGLRRSAILIALIFLIADCSSAASSITYENDGHQANTFPVTHVEPILVEGLPPLMCGEELCDRPLRLDLRGDAGVRKDGWWHAYGPDLD